MVYKWYILPIGGLYGTYHLLREPGNSIDWTVSVQLNGYWRLRAGLSRSGFLLGSMGYFTYLQMGYSGVITYLYMGYIKVITYLYMGYIRVITYLQMGYIRIITYLPIGYIMVMTHGS